ncbi:MAG: tetratricopeptide repeat protein [Chitinivibrionales bacterium]
MFNKTLAILFMILLRTYAAQECPYGDGWDSRGGGEKKKLLEQRQTSELTPQCFAFYLVRKIESANQHSSIGMEVLEAIDTYAQQNRFDIALLHALSSSHMIVDQIESVDLRELWRAHNGSFREHISSLSDRGMYQEADSVYEGMHAFDVLDIYDLLRWTKIKGVIGDFHGLGRLVCEVRVKDERLAQIAQNHMHGQFADAEPHQRNVALQTYQDCYLATSPPDSTDFGLWLAEQYERYGFLKKQLIVLKRMVPDNVYAGRQLLLAAHRRFSDGMHALARDAAKAAYRRLPDRQVRSECASLVYRAYDALGNTDSALVWMQRIDLEDPSMVAHAISMYQKTSRLELADSMISALPQSFEKDTFTLRQMIFQDRCRQAYDSLQSFLGSRRWKREAGGDALLWRLRLAAFLGRAEEIPVITDSASFSPTDPRASEILRLKYEALKLASFPQAAKLWAEILQKSYMEIPEAVLDSFAVSSFPADIQNLLMIKLLEALVGQQKWQSAQRALSMADVESPGAHMQYLTAQIQYRNGEKKQAEQRLEELILNHPGDVFASKARIYLMEMSSREKR